MSNEKDFTHVSLECQPATDSEYALNQLRKTVASDVDTILKRLEREIGELESREADFADAYFRLGYALGSIKITVYDLQRLKERVQR